MQSKLVKHQKKTLTKQITYDGIKADIVVTIRHDDKCGNGYNTFAITGDIYKTGSRRGRDCFCSGCIHDEIEKYLPELKPLIKWHLTSTDEPMHYVANSLYHARDTDHNGMIAGEPCRFETTYYFDGFPIRLKIKPEFAKWLLTLENFDLEVMAAHHKPDPSYDWSPNYTFLPYSADDWVRAPFSSEIEALEFLEALQSFKVVSKKLPTQWVKSVTPNLEAARNSAVWPEAELSDFTEENLKARLPKLMADFKIAIESIGMEY